MITSSLRRLVTPIATVTAVGLVVALAAWLMAGHEGLRLALTGLGTTYVIAVVSEFAAAAALVEQPVFRMLMTMLTRAFGAALVIGVAAASGIEPKLLVLVATPLYLSLIAGEAYDALRELKPEETGPTPEQTAAGA